MSGGKCNKSYSSLYIWMGLLGHKYTCAKLLIVKITKGSFILSISIHPVNNTK